MFCTHRFVDEGNCSFQTKKKGEISAHFYILSDQIIICKHRKKRKGLVWYSFLKKISISTVSVEESSDLLVRV